MNEQQRRRRSMYVNDVSQVSLNPFLLIPEELHNYDIVILRRTVTAVSEGNVKSSSRYASNDIEGAFERKQRRRSQRKSRRCVCCVGWKCCGGRQKEMMKKTVMIESLKEISSSSSSSLSAAATTTLQSFVATPNTNENATNLNDDGVRIDERYGMIFYLDEIFPGMLNKGAMFFEFSKNYEDSGLVDLLTHLSKESGTALFYFTDVVQEEYEKCRRLSNEDMRIGVMSSTRQSAPLTLVKLEMLWRQLDRSLDISGSVEEIENESARIYAKLWQLRRVFSLSMSTIGERSATPVHNSTATHHFRQPGTPFSSMRQIAMRNNRKTTDAILFSTLEDVFGDILLYSGFIQSGVSEQVLQTIVRRLFHDTQTNLILKHDDVSNQSNFYFEAITINFSHASTT